VCRRCLAEARAATVRRAAVIAAKNLVHDLDRLEHAVPTKTAPYRVDTYASDEHHSAMINAARPWLGESSQEGELTMGPEGNLYVYGGRGRGKTTLAYVLARKFLENFEGDYRVRWVRVDDAVRHKDFDDDGVIGGSDLLVLGAAPDNDRARERISEWINVRNEMDCWTITTSLHKPLDLARQLAPSYNAAHGGALTSRLIDNGMVIDLGGDAGDARLRNATVVRVESD
jgi:hypothetical protein